MIQGASTLDALLSNELATKTIVSQVLEIYSRIRQPLATEVARRPCLNGEHFSTRTPSEPADHDLSSTARLRGIAKQIQDNFEFSETEASDLQRAMTLLWAELGK